ncbi:hypothetical protein CKM354_000691700 [Cercospora kikuchii]|uniref:Uncharacterized protein n=1 Tax=Cercospora kikuchii TaxID=84275 RepID=A0A9P3CNI3_9PEZI|nr:uncharacterized protein CKM354_000691700 [Cercospora kikuchii]GIZ43700.1 hypothetical protein CKM354_000691700 [Cercospora kikuchii]
MQTEVMSVNGARGAGEGVRGGGGGTKRKADESVAQNCWNDYERFAKRFNLLNLEPSINGTHASSSYYIPVSSSSQPTKPTLSTPSTVPVADADGMMQVDETRDRVFIHDLDAELAESEPTEERLIFLPDIEKHFSRIPKHVLTGKAEDVEGQELVLYNVPKSLSVDESRDAVRHAIVEARQRARERAAMEARQRDMDRQYGQIADEPTEVAHGYGMGYVTELDEVEDDPDAMDMD